MALRKSQIKSILENVPFPQDSYWILMGAAMVLYGIKDETNDIDMGCTDALFERIRHAGYPVTVNRMGKEKIRFSNEITIYKNWEYEDIIFIDGLPVCDINTIIKDKRNLAREKDLMDLQLIARYQGDDKMG